MDTHHTVIINVYIISDVKHGLIGVGMIGYDERFKYATLEKGLKHCSTYIYIYIIGIWAVFR